jgi:hypothetical protein
MVYCPSVGLEDGLRATYAWFVDQAEADLRVL